jgi:hypothetical protein
LLRSYVQLRLRFNNLPGARSEMVIILKEQDLEIESVTPAMVIDLMAKHSVFNLEVFYANTTVTPPSIFMSEDSELSNDCTVSMICLP